MTHDELAESLAAHLRGAREAVVWTDMQMGPAGSPRPDVYAINRSYARFNAEAFEVKASAADLLRDLTAGKWRAYQALATGVTFAMAADLAKSHGTRVPASCGLIVREPSGSWRYRRRPVQTSVGNLPRDVWLKLLIDGVDRETRRRQLRPNQVNEWRCADALGRKWGERAATIIEAMKRDPAAFEIQAAEHLQQIQHREHMHQEALANMRRRHDAEMQQREQRAGELVRSIAAAMGCEYDEVIDRLHRVKNTVVESPHHRSQAQFVQQVAGECRDVARALDDLCAVMSWKPDERH